MDMEGIRLCFGPSAKYSSFGRLDPLGVAVFGHSRHEVEIHSTGTAPVELHVAYQTPWQDLAGPKARTAKQKAELAGES